MGKIKITFPDGNSKEFDAGITALEIVKGIGPRLAKDAIAAKLDDSVIDLTRPINNPGKLKILTFKDPEGVDVYRHSSAHLLAYAISELFPNAKNTIGPPVEEGFYYDFDELKITPEDFTKIEARVMELAKKDFKFERIALSKNEALKLFKDNKYKIEIIDEVPKMDEISAYRCGDFIDLCHGPHAPSSGYIKSFKLIKLAGAYWRGDSKNKMLTRIYGISFPEKKMLDDHFKMIEEAEKRDHRKIGQQLDLFSISEESPGSIFFHPKGAVIYNELMKLIREEYFKRGYHEVITPNILNKNLWVTSGHWDHYKENMYLTKIEGNDFAVKPMNCPADILIFKSRPRSYRELPLRLADFGVLHRNELSGVLSGLFRVRKFVQDDAHIFVTKEQIKEEVKKVIDFIDFIYSKVFDFNYSVELSTRPEKFMGSADLWNFAEAALADALKEKKIDFKINAGDGAFYGPKIDFHIKDSLNRNWQCGTIQLDFQMPERFGLRFMGEDGTYNHTPVIIHRAILGSIERFMGILIEHYAGKFPLWISPIQARIVTVTDAISSYANDVYKKLKDNWIRVELDDRAETINKKVREAQLDKVYYILAVGEKEAKTGTLAVRTLDGKVKFDVKVDDFIKEFYKEKRDTGMKC